MSREIQQEIDRMLEQGFHDIYLPMCPIEVVSKALIKHGYSEDHFNPNGWQVDFWQYYTAKGKPRLCLHGSLYYGGYAGYYKLMIHEKDTTEEGDQRVEKDKQEENGEETHAGGSRPMP